MKPCIIVGGGVAGLAAASTLQELRRDYAVLEGAPAIGGLTRSIQVDQFRFDYTGHLLHLARSASPEGVPYANLRDADWQQITRKSVAYLRGNLITAPVQYHLGELPSDLFEEVRRSYEARPTGPVPEDASLRDYVVAGFGQALADMFLIPLNEKTQAISLDRLSKEAIKRFFPQPIEERVRAGMASDHVPESVSYNSQFWYPRFGGIDRLVRDWPVPSERIHRLCEVAEIRLAERTVVTTNGEAWQWGHLLSSMPLRTFCERCDDPALQACASALSHSSTVCFNLGVRGVLPAQLEGVHWVYFPDRDIPFYRIGFYSNISKAMCSPGHFALYVEVGLTPDELAHTDIHAELQSRVFEAIGRLGWFDPRDIVANVVSTIRCAYTHSTPALPGLLASIRARLAEADVHLIGRYGQWDYVSMEDAIYNGVETARALC